MTPMKRVHGGPDGGSPLRWDFSVNANAVGPCPAALVAVRLADRCRYPDPAYAALREALGRFHRVPAGRVVIGGSASELIMRISHCASRRGVRRAWWPPAAYGDYAHAAGVAGLQRTETLEAAGLAWLCEPASPTGRHEPGLLQLIAGHSGQAGQAWRVLDAAYEPLRLSGAPSLDAGQRSHLWQLWTPNKALGLTGVRAAYALAPVGSADAVQALEAAAPSWVLGAEGVALLSAWTTPAVQRWLAGTLPVLREWKRLQLDWLQARGWHCQPGDTPFLCVQPPRPLDLTGLRRHGIGLRDAASLGMPGWYRMAVLPPPALQALDRAVGSPAGHTVCGAGA
ncbi:aminotransferase class I/II-fold pyridoxal phosphate-dependent enzyme [uncultured Hydrogenophaga sp.]|uniref:aminotransferase class I/II-fold pyridoxal phosphate-dependent enzyme n=1 Tax=uncultured Hydrogenophaga sp. TaxID=199683 RepID=UPI00265FF7D3|nr:aminotransferase class I/II-fold pyridoxal phosphate-dependent enzyme [uncultured Hydrogenophaga sp.]